MKQVDLSHDLPSVEEHFVPLPEAVMGHTRLPLTYIRKTTRKSLCCYSFTIVGTFPLHSSMEACAGTSPA